jgi:hypothetical protein
MPLARPFLLKGAIAGAGSDLGVVAAGGWTVPVDGAAAGLLIEEDAVAVGPTGQGEDFASGIEVVYHPALFQAPGDFPGRLLQVEGIDHLHPDQIVEIHFDGQAAAGGAAVVAEMFSIPDPGRRMVDVARLSDRGFHGARLSGWNKRRAENLRRAANLFEPAELPAQRPGTLIETAPVFKERIVGIR